MADGEPRGHNAGWQVRLRLCRRLDEEGLGICLAAAEENGARLPVTALIDQFYKHVQARGGNRFDTSSLMVLLTDD